MVLIDAIKRAGTTDGPKLREALAATKDFQGATGRITFDAQRNPTKSAVVLMTNVENTRAPLSDLYVAIARMLAPRRVEPPTAAGKPALSVAAELMGQMQAGDAVVANDRVPRAVEINRDQVVD